MPRGQASLLPRQTETLHSLGRAVFADQDFIPRVHGHRAGQHELAGVGSAPAPLSHQLACRREMVYTLIMRLDNDNIALAVAAQAFGFAQVGLRHLPGEQEHAVGGEFLHPARHIHNVEIVLQVHRHRARLVELTQADTSGANDLRAAEKPARDGRFVAGRARRAAGQRQQDEQARGMLASRPSTAPAAPRPRPGASGTRR